MSKYEKLDSNWIDEHKWVAKDIKTGVTDYAVADYDLQNLLVPKQEDTARKVLDKAIETGKLTDYDKQYIVIEKPTIPQFMADWIEETKPYNSLRVAFEYIAQRKRDNHDDELAFWVEEGNSETFARAWLDGFTVEEEQRYYVLGKHDTPILFRDYRNRITETSNLSDIYPKANSEDFEFTEQEIKDYDPRYMSFAVKVEELEE